MDDSTPKRETNKSTGASNASGWTYYPPGTMARPETPEEMLANYDTFRLFVYEKLRDEGVASAPDLPAELVRATIAREEGAMPPETREEKLTNYPFYRTLVYKKVREDAERLPPLPDDVDLEALIRAEGGRPLEAFIHELFGGKDESAA